MKAETPQSPLRLWRDPLAWAVTLATLGLSAAIAFDVTPLLRGPAPFPPEWQWRYTWPPNLRPAWLPLPVGTALLIGLWAHLTRKRASIRAWALLILSVLALAFWLAQQTTNIRGLQIVARTLNPGYYSVFEPATQIDDLHAFLDTYVENHEALTYRQRSHPPGNTVFFWSIVQAVRALPFVTEWLAPVLEPRLAALPDWIARYTISDVVAGIAASLAVPALAAATVFPLYGLSHHLSGPRAARLSVVLYVLAPAMSLFVPVIDLTYTLIATTAAWLTVKGLAGERRLMLGLAGFVAGIGSFMSYSMLPAGLFVGLVIILHYADHFDRATLLGRLLPDAVALVTGALLVWGLAWAFFGLDPIGTFVESVASHENARARSYWLWLLYNPYDVLLFAGIPVATHVLLALVRLARRLRARSVLTPAERVLAAFALAMLATLLAGFLRGETARTLLYVVPLLAWAAAGDATRGNAHPAGYGALLGALMVIQTIVFGATLEVYH